MDITNAIPIAGRHISVLPDAVNNILSQTRLPEYVIFAIGDYNISLDEYTVKKCTELLESNGIKVKLNLCSSTVYPGHNRYLAYNLCETDIIAFQDCDDLCHKQRNEILLKAFEKTNLSQLLHCCIRVWPGKTDEGYNQEDWEASSIKWPLDIITQTNPELYDRNKRMKLQCAHGPISINKAKTGDVNFPFHQNGEDVELVDILMEHNRENDSMMGLIKSREMYIWRNFLSSLGGKYTRRN